MKSEASALPKTQYGFGESHALNRIFPNNSRKLGFSRFASFGWKHHRLDTLRIGCEADLRDLRAIALTHLTLKLNCYRRRSAAMSGWALLSLTATPFDKGPALILSGFGATNLETSIDAARPGKVLGMQIPIGWFGRTDEHLSHLPLSLLPLSDHPEQFIEVWIALRGFGPIHDLAFFCDQPAHQNSPT